MNEWSPKELYSGSMATEQQQPQKIYRQYWGDNWNQIRENSYIKDTMNHKIKEYKKQHIATTEYEFLNEEVGIPSNLTIIKKKKNGVSDPRFKRIINTELANHFCSDFYPEKISKVSNLSQTLEKSGLNGSRLLTDNVVSYWKAPDEAPLFSTSKVKKFENNDKNCQNGKDLTQIVTKDVGIEAPLKRFTNSDSFSANTNGFFNESSKYGCFLESERNKINSISNLKRSVSDCTLLAKANYRVDHGGDETLHKMKIFPSATRFNNKVHTWATEYKLPPEKRRSVITVIGQTEYKPFSKILNEINQRRKLAKELDKHALCKAIMESTETQSDVKNLIAKLDFVLPDGKIIYSTEKVYLCSDNGKYEMTKTSEERIQKNMDTIETNDKFRRRTEMIPERDPSLSQLEKKNKSKRSNKKTTGSKDKMNEKDHEPSRYTRVSRKLFWSFIVLLALVLYVCIFHYKIKPPDKHFITNIIKPKGRAWYKKLLL